VASIRKGDNDFNSSGLKYMKCMKNVDSSARCCGWAHQWPSAK